MSSELIGELGQVGLTIGEPPTRSSQEQQNYHHVNDALLNTQTVVRNNKRAKLNINRPKRFRQAWMMFDIFKDWLRPHSSPEFATCIACNRVIKAGKSELEKHAVGKKHLRMLKGVAQNMVFLGQEVSPQDFSDNFDMDESGYSGTETTSLPIQREGEQQFTESGSNSASEVQVAETSPASQQMTRIQLANSNMSHQPEAQLVTSKAFVTKPAPPWRATAIVNGHVTKLDLVDYKGRYLILFFYPQDFSKLCASEVNILSDRITEFRAIHTEIVACSVDSHLSHLAWSKTPRLEGGIGNPKIPIIADPTHTIAKDYGVLLPEKGHSLRAHFIIDSRGILRHMSINDIGVGRGTDELLRVVKALQHIDETEGICLADWKPADE